MAITQTDMVAYHRIIETVNWKKTILSRRHTVIIYLLFFRKNYIYNIYTYNSIYYF